MDLSFHQDFYGTGDREQQHLQHYPIPYHIAPQQLPFVVDQAETQKRREDRNHIQPVAHSGTGPLRSHSIPTCQPSSEPSYTYTPSLQHITTLHPSSQPSAYPSSTTPLPVDFAFPPPRSRRITGQSSASNHDEDSGLTPLLPPASSSKTQRPVSSPATLVQPNKANKSSVLPSTSNLHKDILRISGALKRRKAKAKSKTKDEQGPGCYLPDFLRFKFDPVDMETITGLVARKLIEEDTLFGPYEGNLVDGDDGAQKESTWELCLHGTLFLYMDGKRKGRSHMMSYIQCARNKCEQNLEAFQSNGDIYFRTIKAIEPGEELKVFYSEMYSDLVGFKTKLDDLVFLQDENEFECKHCSTKLPSAKQMIRHIKFEHESNASMELLPVVSWMVNTPNKIETAAKKPSEENESENVCRVCGKDFTSRGRLQAHSMFHEFSEELTCPVCGDRESNAIMMKKHMTLHRKEARRTRKSFKCNKPYMRISKLNKHDMHKTPDMRDHDVEDTSNKRGRENMIDENVVNQKEQVDERTENVEFTNDRSVNSNDERTSTVSDPEKVKAFNPAGKAKNIVSKSSIVSWKKKAKTNPDEPVDMLGKAVDYFLVPRPFKCRYCPNRYSKKHLVITHEKEVHEGKGNYKCNDCSKQFMSQIRFLEHMKGHHQNRLFRCTLCPRSFASEVALTNHQGEHTGLKPFKCELCGRGFGKKKNVDEHKRRMHRDRPYRFFCSVCEKGFCDKGALKQHERRHKGIRPFVCLECGKGFTTKYSLQTHVRSMHEEKRPYKCDICSKTFTLNHSFTSHMFRHQIKGQGVEQGPADNAE